MHSLRAHGFLCALSLLPTSRRVGLFFHPACNKVHVVNVLLKNPISKQPRWVILHGVVEWIGNLGNGPRGVLGFKTYRSGVTPRKDQK